MAPELVAAIHAAQAANAASEIFTVDMTPPREPNDESRGL